MHKSKRAQGLPITTIILAILGLVVLVILFAITTGRLAIFAGVTNECPGECVKGMPAGQAGTGESECPPFTRELPGSFIEKGSSGPGKTPVVCKKCCQ